MRQSQSSKINHTWKKKRMKENLLSGGKVITNTHLWSLFDQAWGEVQSFVHLRLLITDFKRELNTTYTHKTQRTAFTQAEWTTERACLTAFTSHFQWNELSCLRSTTTILFLLIRTHKKTTVFSKNVCFSDTCRQPRTRRAAVGPQPDCVFLFRVITFKYVRYTQNSSLSRNKAVG